MNNLNNVNLNDRHSEVKELVVKYRYSDTITHKW